MQPILILPKLKTQLQRKINLLAFMLLIFNFPSFAETFVQDQIVYAIQSTSGKSGTVIVKSTGFSISGDIVIPSTVVNNETTYQVVEIGEKAFELKSGLTSITIPSGVTKIGKNAFRNCSGLKSLTIHEGVAEIGMQAFAGCDVLKSVTIPNGVLSIGEWAFGSCAGLTSITIPDSVEKIGNGAFAQCPSLQKIIVGADNRHFISTDDLLYSAEVIKKGTNRIVHLEKLIACPGGKTSIAIAGGVEGVGDYACRGCRHLKSVTIPESVTSIGEQAFDGCTGLTSIDIPNSVTVIGDFAFSGCSGLKSIDIPDNVKEIGAGAFDGCAGLTYLKIPDNITLIDDYTFSDCSSLKSITIPDNVKSIGDYSFQNCTGLVSLTLPENITSIGACAFNGCTLKPLKILSKSIVKFNERTINHSTYNSFSGLNPESVIVCHDVTYKTIKSYWTKGKVYSIESPDFSFDVKTYYCGISIDCKNINPYFEDNEGERKQLFAGISEEDRITDVPITVGSSTLIKGLSSDKNYTLKIYYKEDYDVVIFTKKFKTEKPSIECQFSTTQTTITINSVKAAADESYTPDIYVQGEIYNGGELKFTGLRPNERIEVKVYYNRYEVSKIISTKDIGLSIIDIGSYPTSIQCNAKYFVGDTKFDKIEWVIDRDVFKDLNTVLLTGLEPETEYTFRCNVTVVCDDGYKYVKSVSKTIKTEPLELKMQIPKSVGGGKTIVSALTNISEDEANVGFEWKKSDAPVTLPYIHGYSVICDGQLEGLIKNLQNTYYDARAFYKTAAGKYYYSEIISFDPTDFSYFEPTVHTYPAQAEETQATLRGYVLSGTDNILGQGFQYWIASGGAQHVIGYGTPTSGHDIKTVVADGQRMSAVITGLRPCTPYIYRTYVVTESGYKYGEEQSFTTLGTTGIEDSSIDVPEVTVLGYYDLQGRCYDEPQLGFNIILYSDGTTSKIMCP